MKAGEHPSDGLEREIYEESGLVVSADEVLQTRTDRQTARLDICYVGKLLGGEFEKTHEVSEYGFFKQDSFPLLRKNQLFLIDKAIKERQKK